MPDIVDITALPHPTLIGMLHLAALPGTARAERSIDDIADRAIADAHALHQAGFDAAFIENYGDIPFVSGALPPASLAGLAVVADRVRQACPLPLGINALRNDALAALGIAAVCGASFVRVNVHSGVSATDSGMLQGRAAETLAYRRQLGVQVGILADVHVKHATPVSEPEIGQCAKDTAYRGLADGLIVTGVATGSSVLLEDLDRVREAVPDRPLFVGSGVTVKSVASICRIADGVIVGTAIKEERQTENPVSLESARALVDAARQGGRS